MGVFRPDKDTTKVRVVFLSNLSEKSFHPNVYSYNQALLPGPCMNNKITTTVILSRFNKFMFTFDIAKAFLNIALNIDDQNRLLFLGFNSVENNDFSLIAYRSRRLLFGLRSSPALLMLALYRILILDTDNDSSDIV